MVRSHTQGYLSVPSIAAVPRSGDPEEEALKVFTLLLCDLYVV